MADHRFVKSSIICEILLLALSLALSRPSALSTLSVTSRSLEWLAYLSLVHLEVGDQ